MFIRQFRAEIKRDRRISNQKFCTCENVYANFQSYYHSYKQYQSSKNDIKKKKIAKIVFEEIAGIYGRPTKEKRFYENSKLINQAYHLFKKKVLELNVVFQERMKVMKQSCSDLCGIPNNNSQLNQLNNITSIESGTNNSDNISKDEQSNDVKNYSVTTPNTKIEISVKKKEQRIDIDINYNK